MESKFNITTVGLIYKDNGEILITKRSQKEEHMPGEYSYPGGKVKYTKEEKNNLENNLKREIKEEVNVEVSWIKYINSHCFKNANDEKTTVIAYLAKYVSGNPVPNDPNEVSEVKWIKKSDVESLITIKSVKEVYLAAFKQLEELDSLHHVSVAGLIINEADEFLLVKYTDEDDVSSSKLTFPFSNVKKYSGTTWEIFERSLTQSVLSQTGYSLADGPIPFTDEGFLGPDGFETMVQFYICRLDDPEPKKNVTAEKIEVMWKRFDEFNFEDFEPLVYEVFEKAFLFINKLRK